MATNPRRPGISAEQQVENATITSEALKLRAQGLTYEQIGARQGGVGKRTAHRRVMKALKRLVDEPAEEVLKLELERLDRALRRDVRSIASLNALVAKWEPQAEGGDLEAAELLIKAHAALLKANAGFVRTCESRRVLLGLDAPEKKDVTIKDAQATPANARRLMQEFFGGHVGPLAIGEADEAVGQVDVPGAPPGTETHH